MPVLAIADRAKSMAAIRVQLVKYILHLLNGTVWPARGARRLGYCMSGDVKTIATTAIARKPRTRGWPMLTGAERR